MFAVNYLSEFPVGDVGKGTLTGNTQGTMFCCCPRNNDCGQPSLKKLRYETKYCFLIHFTKFYAYSV